MRGIGKSLLTFSLCLMLIILAACQGFSVSGNRKNIKSVSTGEPGLTEAKIYEIPFKERKRNYSTEDFKALLAGFDKLNNIEKRETIENDKTERSEVDKLKYYRVFEITPENVKK